MNLDFIETGAPDCPLLRLAPADPAAVKRLVRALQEVTIGSTALDGSVGIKPVGGVRLSVSVGDADLGVSRNEDGSFSWVMDGEGWRQVIELLAPFAESPGTGFQYLNRAGIVVVISTDGRW